jgi:putative FmdB family regulatory protein
LPIYEYRCTNGHNFEVKQSMTDEPIAACPDCGALVQRVFHPVAVHFKGSGFYTTDYGRRGSGAADSSKDGSKSETKSESKSESKSDGKEATASKSEGSGGSGGSGSSSAGSSDS